MHSYVQHVVADLARYFIFAIHFICALVALSSRNSFLGCAWFLGVKSTARAAASVFECKSVIFCRQLSHRRPCSH